MTHLPTVVPQQIQSLKSRLRDQRPRRESRVDVLDVARLGRHRALLAFAARRLLPRAQRLSAEQMISVAWALRGGVRVKVTLHLNEIYKLSNEKTTNNFL